MSVTSILLLVVVYFSVLMIIAAITGRHSTDNDAFFLGNRKTPWWVVAIGMVGSSISGVSFISVPGMVGGIGFTYMQTVFGFFFGYLIIANVLLPLYYNLGLTSIYTYLDGRFGKKSYKTGATFFLISKIIGASARLYVVALILQTLVFDAWKVPFPLTVSVTIFLIWLYTYRSGIKTIVWTDTIQAVIMIAALVMLVYELYSGLSAGGNFALSELWSHQQFNIFVFDDWMSKQHFVKQFFSGVFIAVVMTGLDQDMMQKNLTCRSLKDAKKNMYWYGFAFIPVNFLFLLLGLMLLVFASQYAIELPTKPDQILPFLATNYLGKGVLFLFVLGIISAAFSSADSAMAAVTTSVAVDLLNVQKVDSVSGVRLRRRIHAMVSVVFILIILLFHAVNDKSVIDAIYIIASYSYGPLLGMYTYGLFTKRTVNDRLVPFIAVFSPLFCYLLNVFTQRFTGYSFGYELLMLNGFITFAGLWWSGSAKPDETPVSIN